MDHPYSGPASYIYANDHPSTPAGAQSKIPYRPSLVQSPASYSSQYSSQAKPRTSHDSSWSTEGTYTRVQRPKHVDSSPAPAAPATHRPRGYSQSSGPLFPLRAPIAHPYQQRNTSWVEPEPDSEPQPEDSASVRTPAEAQPVPVQQRSPVMTPYARDGDPLSLRHSAFVPHEPRPFEQRGSFTWQDKVEKGQKRIQRAIMRLRRWTCTVIPD